MKKIRGQYWLSNERSDMQLETIHVFMQRTFWAQDRSKETVMKSIENSLNYGVFHEERQVAFARVVTDYCTYAYLCDVFVDEEYRGKGLSKWMMEEIMSHPELSDLRRFTLATRDAHGLYEQFGFKSFTPEEQRRFMQVKKGTT